MLANRKETTRPPNMTMKNVNKAELHRRNLILLLFVCDVMVMNNKYQSLIDMMSGMCRCMNFSVHVVDPDQKFVGKKSQCNMPSKVLKVNAN